MVGIQKLSKPTITDFLLPLDISSLLNHYFHLLSSFSKPNVSYYFNKLCSSLFKYGCWPSYFHAQHVPTLGPEE